MYRVDLNCDIGEGFGNYSIGMDQELIKYISSANIACGWHAGDSVIMDETVAMAKKFGVAVGAHPGYLDMAGFGRRNINVNSQELKTYIKYQLGALSAFAKSHGVKVEHLKPHGAMYNMAAKDCKLAAAISEAVYEVDPEIVLLGLANSELIKAGEHVGLRVASEVFADRAYMSDGTLVPRNEKDAVIHDSRLAVERALKIVKYGIVDSIDGNDIEIKAHSICVHGDNIQALELVKKIRTDFVKEGIEVVPLRKILG